MLDILCVGDSVIDIFLKIPTTDPKFSLDKENGKLLINYGDKISVEKYIVSAGLCAEIGNDEFSQKILATLRNENVNIDYVMQDGDKQTSITVALSYAGDRTLFTEHVERKHNFNFENVQAHLIYLTSLGHVWEKAYEKVYEFAKKTDVLLAFNPGSLQLEN